MTIIVVFTFFFFSILAVIDADDARIFLILSSTGHAAILPLLFPEDLILIKILMLSLYTIIASLCLQRLFNQSLLTSYEWIYISFLPFLTIYEAIVHKIIFNERLPFLPLALTSIICAIGIIYSWILYCYIFYSHCSNKVKLTCKTDKLIKLRIPDSN